LCHHPLQILHSSYVFVATMVCIAIPLHFSHFMSCYDSLLRFHLHVYVVPWRVYCAGEMLLVLTVASSA
jgi:hypothetical protein